MKDLLDFINNKNKIAYTMHKAYELGFSDSDIDDRETTLSIIKKMQKLNTTTYFNRKISYAEMCIDFMNIIPYIENMLEIEFDQKDQLSPIAKKPVPAARINKEFFSAIESSFHKDRYTTGDIERLIHSHGQETFKDIYKVLYKSIERTVDLVFYPESENEVKEIIEISSRFNVCLIPYGGGTNVTRALSVPENEDRMVVSIDMRRMSKIEWINKEDRRISVEAGITGSELDDLLKKEGLTIGHEPDSIELSTVGGWIATNASGMKKNRYGNIEDIVENTNFIFPENYIEEFKEAKKNFLLFYDNLKKEDVEINSSEKNLLELENYLINEIEMCPKRVHTAFKKFNHNYK